MSVRIRSAVPEDALEIARLSGHLGYPVTPQEIAERMELLQDANHATLVADIGTSLSGWIAAEKRISLESGIRYEIAGLVVDTTARRTGTGRALVRAIRDWAGTQGTGRLCVRSSIARQESHAFYQALGFEKSKTQHVYVLDLSVAEES